jgi:RNA polymerase sigma-70 factor (ECF subfamily)
MADPPRSPSPDLSATADLLRRARLGDEEALNELIRRHLEPLRRFARGRLPRWSRDLRDTEDLVQDTLAQTIRRVNEFEPRHEGALQGYLRQALVNRIRDEVRRAGRRRVTPGLEGADVVVDPSPSPLEEVIGREAVERYEAALARLREDDRALIVARVELQQSYAQIAAMHGKTNAEHARVAVARALIRLAKEMDVER